MHGVDGKLCAGGVANVAALAQVRVGIGQEVRRLRFRDVASAASRCGGLAGIDPALRIDHCVQADGKVLLAAVDVAHRAVLQIGG